MLSPRQLADMAENFLQSISEHREFIFAHADKNKD
jgi:hypothetical protein